jgi:hypothetical protein
MVKEIYLHAITSTRFYSHSHSKQRIYLKHNQAISRSPTFTVFMGKMKEEKKTNTPAYLSISFVFFHHIPFPLYLLNVELFESHNEWIAKAKMLLRQLALMLFVYE